MSINAFILLILLAILDPFIGNRKSISSEQRSISLREHPPFHDNNYHPFELQKETTEGLVFKDYRLRTDKNGFIIGDEIQINRDSAHIIFFGGSTTECLYVEEKNRFPYLVGEQIQDSMGLKINTLNAGRAGNNSMHSTLMLIGKGLTMKPEMVVLMNNVNDLAILAIMGDYWNSSDSRAILKTDKNSISKQIFNTINSIAKKIYPNIQVQLRQSSKEFLHAFRNQDEWVEKRKSSLSPYHEIEANFDKSISLFIATAKNYNINVALMTQANRFNHDDEFIKSTYHTGKSLFEYDTYRKYYKQLNERIREISMRENILLIDLENMIPANKNYIYDTVHLNNDGSKLAAEVIVNAITNHNPQYSIIETPTQ